MISRNKLHTVSSKFNKKLLLALTLSVLSLAVVWTTAILTETHIAQAAPGDWQWQKRSNGIVGDALYSLSIASSTDGTKLAMANLNPAINTGYIYTSTDSGASWTEQNSAGQRTWTSITSSADGTKLAAVENHWDDNLGQTVGSIYTSTDSGVSWNEQTAAGSRDWQSITSSADGTKLAAVVNDEDNGGGYIYTSTDSGASWSEQTSAGQREWRSITSSADGTKLVVGVNDWNNGGYIYTSTDSGASWTEQNSAGQRTWTSITSSADGTKLAAVENHWDDNLGQTVGSIYTSTDSGVSWNEQTAAGSRDWQSITSSADGTKLAAVVNDEDNGGGYIYTSTDSGATWTERTSAGQRRWSSITSSADGTKLAAVAAMDSVYTSTNSGASWTEQTVMGSRMWYSVTSDSSGTKLAAASIYGYIYTSTDSGVTWTEQTSSGQRTWASITSSANGTKLAAVDGLDNNGYIYTSTDSGVSWTEQTSSGQRSWQSIASSADGTKLAAVVPGGYIYTSTDSGATWTERTSAGQREWQSITSSADGTKLAAVENHWDDNLGQTVGSIYTSTDSGVSWNEQTAAGSRDWQSITSSADGTKLAAVAGGFGDDGYIYTSTDSGASWTEQTSAGQRGWYSIASSGDGTKLAAVDSNNGYIYTSTDSGASWTEQTSAGSRLWISVASSSAGDKLVALAHFGNIYTGTIEQEVVDPPEPPTPPTSNTSNLTTPSSPISAFSLRPVSISTPTGTNITSSSTVPESSLVTQDPNNQYPLGLVNFSFTTNQSSNQVSLSFITDLTPNQVTPKKYNPSTNTYTNLPTSANAVVSETTIDGKHALTLTYTIIDNGELDLDPTAGTISDPVGLAVSNSTYDQLASTGENTQPILLTAVLLLVSGIVGVWYFRRGWKQKQKRG